MSKKEEKGITTVAELIAELQACEMPEAEVGAFFHSQIADFSIRRIVIQRRVMVEGYLDTDSPSKVVLDLWKGIRIKTPTNETP